MSTHKNNQSNYHTKKSQNDNTGRSIFSKSRRKESTGKVLSQYLEYLEHELRNMNDGLELNVSLLFNLEFSLTIELHKNTEYFLYHTLKIKRFSLILICSLRGVLIIYQFYVSEILSMY